MATWKKVVVSGSQAELATLKVDNLTSGQAVIGGGSTSNLSTRVISGSGAILASGGTNIVLSGSFSGSFQGNGSGLTGITANTTNALTAGEGISTFSFNGSSAQTVSVSGAADLTANNVMKWDNTSNKFANSSITDNGTTVSGATSLVFTGANSSLTGSLLGLATSASIADRVANALTFGNGLTGASYNGSTAITTAVGAGPLITVTADAVQVTTSSLATNQIPKFSANALAGSNISDTGTQVQIGVGASSGLSVAAGGINVTGNSTFNNNLTVTGDLTVAGTASFQNTQNLLIGDRFAAFASGSTALTDGGIIVVAGGGPAGMSGSAWFLESTNTSTYGRFATAFSVHASASAVVADEYAVTTKITNANPSAAPTWGGSTLGQGNMWVNTVTEDIFIYS